MKTKKSKWWITKLNLYLQQRSHEQRDAQDGYDFVAVEYDKQFRVFADPGLFLSVGDITKIYVNQLLPEVFRCRDVDFELKYDGDAPAEINPLEDGTCEIKGTQPGSFYVMCSLNGSAPANSKYGIRLTVCDDSEERLKDSLNYMYHMATIPFIPKVNFFFRPTKGIIRKMDHQICYFRKDYTYYGIPYTNRISEKKITVAENYMELMEKQYERLEQKKECENRFFPFKVVTKQCEAIYNLTYPGNDCSTAVGRAWNIRSTGDVKKHFFDSQTLDYPSTFTMMSLKHEDGNYALEPIGLKIKEENFRKNWKEGYDTVKAIKKEKTIMQAYMSVKVGDGLLRYSRVGLFKTGHIMLVRENCPEKKYMVVLDQHSAPHYKRPLKDKGAILNGQSTYSTCLVFTYEQLKKYGYLPVKLTHN